MLRTLVIPFLMLAVLLTLVDAALGQPGSSSTDRRVDRVGDPLPPGAIARIGNTRYRLRGWHQQVFFSPDGNTVLAKGEQGILRIFDVATGKVVKEVKEPELFNWTADQSKDGKLLAVAGRMLTEKRLSIAVLRLYDAATLKPIWTVRPAEMERADSIRVKFTPDGKRLVTAAGNDARIWDAKTGTELLRQKLQFGYGSLDISPDGKTIAAGYYQLYLWDWQSGAEPRQFASGSRAETDGLRFLPDGKKIYVVDSKGWARAFDVATGKPAGRLDLGPSAQWMKFGPDGKRYAVGYYISSYTREAIVSLRDAASGNEVKRLPCGHDHAASGSWSRDGSRFAAATDNRVWVWDVKSGKLFGPEAPAHEASITEMAFAPDGGLFTASDDHSVRAWDPATGRQLIKLEMMGLVRGMALSPRGDLVAGSGLRNDFRVWQTDTRKELFKLAGHGELGGLRRVRFSADGKTLLSYGDDFFLRAWDVRTGKLKSEHRLRPKLPFARGDADEDDDRMEMMMGPSAVCLGPDGNTFIRATGKDVSIYSADAGKELSKFEADPQRVDNLALSPNGKQLLTTGPGVDPPKPKPGAMPAQLKDYQVTVWDLETAKPIVRFRVRGSAFAGILQFTPDGGAIVTGSYNSPTQMWDAKTGVAIGTIELPDRPAKIAFDAGGKRLAVAFWDTTAVVYNLADILKPAKK